MSVPKNRKQQAPAPKPKGQKKQTHNAKGQKPGKEEFYKPVALPRASVGGQKKALPAVRMVVAAPVPAAPVVINWTDVHAEFTRRIADLTPKVTSKATEFEVEDTKMYKDWKKEMEDLLAAETTSIEELLKDEVPENHKKVTQGYADEELKEYDKKIQDFWRDVKRAFNIRARLRTGVDKYFQDPHRTIAELYAGSPSDASEVMTGQSYFAKLISTSTWFNHSNGSTFVQHAGSRSASLGYHVSGTEARVHIGHTNDKDRR